MCIENAKNPAFWFLLSALSCPNIPVFFHKKENGFSETNKNVP